ncbi:hypothetical protein [Chishuiella sp.]|uniref:hypothetical protein n=1 Tax=Chishuiella sp. TaxID=1969467 RepID=UPI0028AF5455|nr:hypothetical protein [Chishuiella sp.]
MKTIKNSLALSFIFLGTIFSNAQQISILANAGMQGLSYNIDDGNNTLKLGARIGVGYTYFLNYHLAIITGLELGTYSNKTTLNNSVYSSDEIDTDGELFEFRVKTKGYKEENQFNALSIPLMLQYRTIGDTQFYFNGGGRIFLPFGQKSTITMNQLQLTGFYSDVNAELFDIPNHGFETFDNWKSTSNTKLNTAFALSAETGLSFELDDNIRLYTGIYIDYGLNDMQKKQQIKANISLINYNDAGYNDKQFNSILKTNRITDQTKLMAYGIQLKLEFGPRYRGRGCSCY